MQNSILEQRNGSDALVTHEVQHATSQRRESVIPEVESVLAENALEQKLELDIFDGFGLPYYRHKTAFVPPPT
jgi:hypothetical protein